MADFFNADLWQEYRKKNISNEAVTIPSSDIYRTPCSDDNLLDMVIGKDMSAILVSKFEGKVEEGSELEFIPTVEEMLIDDVRFATLYQLIIDAKTAYPEHATHLEAIARYVYQTFPLVNTHTKTSNPVISDDNPDLRSLFQIHPSPIPQAFFPIAEMMILNYANRDRYFLNMAMKIISYIRELDTGAAKPSGNHNKDVPSPQA